MRPLSFDANNRTTKEHIEIEVEVIAYTDAAILVRTDVGEDWIPKSQISDFMGDYLDAAESIFISEYLALLKDLI